MGSSVLHRSSADALAVSHVPDVGVSKSHIRMGARPPSPSQIHRHERRPAQLGPRIFLLAYGLVDGPQTPGRYGQGPQHRHERLGSRPGGHVSKKVRLVSRNIS